MNAPSMGHEEDDARLTDEQAVSDDKVDEGDAGGNVAESSLS